MSMALGCNRRDDIKDDPKPVLTESISLSAGIEVSSDSRDTDDKISNALDKVNNEISGFVGGRKAFENECGITVTTVSGSYKSFSIVFNQTQCTLAEKKSGTITVNLVSGNRYRDLGAKWEVMYENYTIEKDNKKLVLNGKHTVENLTGGLPRLINSTKSTVSFLITSNNMKVKLDTLGEKTWNLSRKQSWEIDSTGILSFTLEGKGNADGYTNLVVWGVNRASEKFYTQITSPIIFTSKCTLSRPSSGERKHTLVKANNGNIIITDGFKYNSDGCANGYYITIERNGAQKSFEVSY